MELEIVSTAHQDPNQWLKGQRFANGSQSPVRREEIRTLFHRAVADDDRAAQDEILAGLTGPAGITGWLERRAFGEVAFGPSNRDLTRIGTGKRGRGTTPDGATPDGIAFAMGELFAGRVLKEETTALLMQQFARHTATGNAAGWDVLRLTGVSPIVGPVSSAGGVALVRSRTGQRYVIVAFTSGSGDLPRTRDTLLTDAVSELQRY